jgi:hypothetical protein
VFRRWKDKHLAEFFRVAINHEDLIISLLTSLTSLVAGICTLEKQNSFKQKLVVEN